jgi:hypothetical protein
VQLRLPTGREEIFSQLALVRREVADTVQ